MFNIEKGIPLPTNDSRGRKKGQLRLTLESMEVGDSFIIQQKHRCQIPQISRLISIKCRTRMVGDDEVRVWRTE